MRTLHLALAITSAAALLACGEDFSGAELQGEIPFEENRPTTRSYAEIDRYDGDDPIVLSAQERIPTGLELHRKVIWRTCTPNGGVCHNQKEYPDLHSPSNFIAAIGAPCNVQPGEWQSVFNRCEQTGDRFNFITDDGRVSEFKDIEIGFLERVPGEDLDNDIVENIGDGYTLETWIGACVNDDRDEATCTKDFELLDLDADGSFEPDEIPGLHIYLQQGVPFEQPTFFGDGVFIRDFITEDDGQAVVDTLPFFRFRTRWTVFGWSNPRLEGDTSGRRHLHAEVRGYQTSAVNELLSVGVIQGDLNRDGVFGARTEEPVALIVPGNPELSYIVARMRGTMLGDDVPGTRMPLANTPLSVDEMLALFCFIEGLPDVDRIDATLEWPIDYKNCSFSDDPLGLDLLGAGPTWKSGDPDRPGGVSNILDKRCGGCHAGNAPEADLDLVSGGPDEVYNRLMNATSVDVDMPLITAGDLDNSYLWLKLVNDPSIVGKPMPYNSLTDYSPLPDSRLANIKAWIVDGAQNNTP